MIKRIALGIVVGSLLAIGYLVFHAHVVMTLVPTGADMETANAVAKVIADGYSKFDNRQVVESTYKGKIYYNAPGVNGTPTIDFYEVTSVEDMAQIEELARKALISVPAAKSITLTFYAAQNMHRYPNGGVVRGEEQVLKKVTVERSVG
jgi:hypothetical protein